MKGNKKIIKLKKYTTLIFLFLFSSHIVFASGLSFPTYKHTPEDLSQLHYLVGNDLKTLDTPEQIIFENLIPRHLYPLYKKMVGDPLSIETKSSLYQDFLVSSDQDQSNYVDPIDLAIESWKKARKQVSGDDIKIDGFGNCRSFAYDNAVATLKNRQKIYTKEQLIEWVKNQDEVFAQCRYRPNITSEISESSNVNEIQTETKIGFWGRIGNFFANIFMFSSGKNESLNKITDKTRDMCAGGKCDFKIKYEGQLQSDYEYQQAAFQYYAGNDFLAEKFFSTIAQNSKHPWSAYAAFSLGRLYVNQYQRLSKDNVLLAKAEKQLTEVLTNPDYAVMHQAAKELLDYVLGQRNPFALFKKSEDILMTSHDQGVLKKAMSDFTDI